MRITTTLFLLLFFFGAVKAQKKFTTIVPQVPVVAGEAFQVQYIVEAGVEAGNFNIPIFKSCRVVAGPNVYRGTIEQDNTVKESRNFVFTLVALTTGRIVIPGAIISIDGKPVRSNNEFVEVISKEMASRKVDKQMTGSSEYFLRPGEDVFKKIRQNLFVRVTVDKKNCFVGQSVLATFKLYSRLESKSDIVKNPGFYGFTVHDMVNLADKQMTSENVNGKAFDVHTIRKVQLYPLQAGVFTIDVMEVKNKVEFSRSTVNKKTEQEIVEGVLGNEETGERQGNAEEFESDMHTEPVTITVKPLPSNNKPVSFDGATGLFTIAASAVKNKLSKGEGDVLEVTIRGRGNFVQLNAPTIQWPTGIEGFEPSVKDSLSKISTPLTGSRTYRYAFVTATSNKYTIPAINFSFFNPDSGKYTIVTTAPVQVSIDNSKTIVAHPAKEEVKQTNSRTIIYWLAGGAMILLLSALFWFLKGRAEKPKQRQTQLPNERKDRVLVNEVLAPAFLLVQADDKTFYSSVRQSIWNYFSFHFNFSGSKMSKENIIKTLNEKQVTEELISEMKTILQQCEAGIFTNASLADDKTLLLDKTKKVLGKLNECLL